MESKAKNIGKATLEVDGKTVELPVYIGSEGDPVIDVRTLYKATGHFTLDPGFTSTASCESQITFIDGEKGILLYRGYPIDQLAEQANFMEVAYLLQYGELPKADELAAFEHDVRMHTMLHTQIDRFFDGFRRDSHPMAMLVGSIGALSAFYSDAMDIEDPEQRRISSIRLIAKMPTLAARIFKYTQGQAYVSPRNDLNYSENFLRMCFKIDAEDYTIDPLMARAMDRIFTLHADHEQNASTSTVRLAGSSDAHPFACIAAGAASLWGPSHGGANEAALNMLREIGRPERIPEFIARAKDKSDPFRLMGFGHRVYRNYDPRARVMQQTAHEVLKATGKQNDPIMAVAMELERIALSDEYFIERQLYPNVDFYSGITLSAMGFPTEMFTVLFALARTAGWVAQWNEFHSDPTSRIGRPRQIYTGPARRDFVPTSAR